MVLSTIYAQFTVEGGTVFAETAQQFIVVDAHEGGTAGSGLILCNTTDPVPPFNPIGNSAWQFVQGSQGMRSERACFIRCHPTHFLSVFS